MPIIKVFTVIKDVDLIQIIIFISYKDISRYHTKTLPIFPKEVPFSKISMVHFGRSCL